MIPSVLPHIDSVTPEVADGHTRITIRGSNFDAESSVRLVHWYAPFTNHFGCDWRIAPVTWTDTEITYDPQVPILSDTTWSGDGHVTVIDEHGTSNAVPHVEQ